MVVNMFPTAIGVAKMGNSISERINVRPRMLRLNSMANAIPITICRETPAAAKISVTLIAPKVCLSFISRS